MLARFSAVTYMPAGSAYAYTAVFATKRKKHVAANICDSVSAVSLASKCCWANVDEATVFFKEGYTLKQNLSKDSF